MAQERLSEERLVIVKEAIVHALKGGMSIGGVLTVLSSLLARKLQRPNSTAISSAVFVSLFRFIEYYDRNQNHEINSKRSAISASSIAFFFFVNKKQHSNILAYVFVQAFLSRWTKFKEQQKTAIVNSINFEIPMIMVASSRVVYSWMFSPTFFEPSHLRSLDYYSCFEQTTLKSARKMFEENCSLALCDVIHPTVNSCSYYLFQSLTKIIKRSAKVFIPIHFMSMVIFKWQKWVHGPRPHVLSISKAYLRSVATLTFFYIIPQASCCYLPILCPSVFKPNNRVTLACAGGLGALTVLMESKSRRKSIGSVIWMYMLVHLAKEWKHKLISSKLIKSALRKIPHHLRELPLLMMKTFVFTCSISQILRYPRTQNRMLIKLLYGY